MRDVASLGLPVHVSEFDCSLQVGRLDFRSRAEKLQAQVRLYHEAIEAYMALLEAEGKPRPNGLIVS